MPYTCPICDAEISPESSTCAVCHSRLDPFGTHSLPTREDPAACSRSWESLRTGSSPSLPRAGESRDEGQTLPSPARGTSVFSPAGLPGPGAAGTSPSVGVFRGVLKKFLGSPQTDEVPAEPSSRPVPVAQPPRRMADNGNAPPPPISTSRPELRPLPTPAPIADDPSIPDPEDESDHTRMMGGADIGRLKIPRHLYALQILNRKGEWQIWTTISPPGLKIGRTEKNPSFPELNSMAVRHLRFSYDGARLLMEDLGSLNGVFVRISRPVELVDGTRFRIGSQVIEFHEAGEPTPVPARRGADGEEFWSRDLVPLAYLDFIRPDTTAGVRLPIIKAEELVIGRKSTAERTVDLCLPGDDLVSSQHAAIRRENGAFTLRDLGSRNGTFVQIRGKTPVKSGEVLLVGRVLLRVIEQPPE